MHTLRKSPNARFFAHIPKKWNGYGAAAMRVEAKDTQDLLDAMRRKVAEASTENLFLKERCEQLEQSKTHLAVEAERLKQRLGELESSAADALQMKTTNGTLMADNDTLRERVMELEDVTKRLRPTSRLEKTKTNRALEFLCRMLKSRLATMSICSVFAIVLCNVQATR